MKAHYNITNDKLFAEFDERLSPENYKAARSAGFVWWPGSKQFVSKWSTQAEDFLRGMGITEIAEDDTPDDVEARVNRFDKYANEAEQGAASAESYLAERANTERRRKNAVNAIEKNLSAAEHWQERIEGAIRHAAFKERPDVIARRIEGLEKDLRKKVADSTPDTRVDGARYGSPNQVWVGQARGGHWVDKDKLPAIQAWAKRWIDHINNRLQYERACLAAVGGIVGGTGAAPMDHDKFQITGAILTRGEWHTITKVNKRTVEVFCPSFTSFHYSKIDRTDIAEVLSPEEAKAQCPQLEAQRKAYVAMMELAHKQAAKLEKEHMAELDEMSRPRKYSELGRYDQERTRERLAQSLQAENGVSC
jgi:hypothetical protein